jgi:acyl carrier protein phosphodiesterase
MNFLAHIYLSGENELIKVGNFIGDWVKGNDYKKFPEDIQKGILLHRSIDYYTDNHPMVRFSKNRFVGNYHKYAGIIIDVCYDHYLAKDWDTFSTVPLYEFNNSMKDSLLKYIHCFPADLQDFIPKFMNFGWMDLYASVDGIEKVLRGMVKHTSLPDKTDEAICIFKDHYSDFRMEFYDYFPQLIDFIEEKFQIPINNSINRSKL